ncbi:alpha/beta hydrolase [Streptomyces sp. TBY4]|uniref:alpha/beta hydrolase n=1 Tax=Streptomyces sp. TBY4 TaxID=2962030 RepID=UPI0020B83827|nr:alpha/beta hydrolase [Streptomyces sp. TBY4]MCP3755578.1 alpha/beta hydrolase [Streptomyces sp. TBY4]
MPLDPLYTGIRDYRVATGFTPLYTMPVEQARVADRDTEAEIWDWVKEPKEVFDFDIDGPTGPMTLRAYRPQTESADDGPLPVVVYFFGGGWVVGSLDTCEAICRAVASLTPCVVVSVGYRLAPEHPFPAAIDDCYAALEWVGEHASELGADPTRIAVAGDSSGGNLAAVMALMARDKGGPKISAQVLVYPPTRNDATTQSMRDHVDPMFFNAESSGWFWGHYLADPADGESPYASPAKAADHSGLPPALLMTAEYCPLYDEGEEYAKTLSDAGVDVEFHPYKDLPHGFLQLSAVLETSRDAMRLIGDFLHRRTS